MEKEIKIKKKAARRGDDGYKVVSVRMKEEMLERLDKLASQTTRSRNELINLLLDAAMKIVKVEEKKAETPEISGHLRLLSFLINVSTLRVLL